MEKDKYFKQSLLFLIMGIAFIKLANAQYCEPNVTCNAWVHITNVSLGDIDNTTACDGGFSDFTSQSTDITIGSTGNTISLTGTNYGGGADDFVHFALWIDFNGNEDFTDAGEKIFSDVEQAIDIAAEYSFDVPANASIGSVRIRVGVSQVAGGWLDWLGPCGSYAGNGIVGEFEDYTINLISGSPAALDADFFGSPITINVGQSVDFNDATSGGTEPYSYNWTFSNGNPSSSNDASPQNITYNSVGTFQVSLQVTDADLNTDMEVKSNYITVVNAPPSVPLSNWAIFASILLIGGIIIVRIH